MPVGIMWFLVFSIFLVLNSITIHGQRVMNDECSALSELKLTLKFDTQLSSKLRSWNSSAECCSWSGVTCKDGQVVSLDLSSEGIRGGLDNSSSLFDLHHLKRLNLAVNNFSAPIPTAIGLLVNLENLNLSNAAFVEQIPVGIAGMTKLRSLDVSVDLSGDLVDSLKFGHLNLMLLVGDLSNLEELRLDGSYISYQGSEWSRALAFSVPNLSVLSLSYCNLFGPPDASLLRLQKLSSISLAYNNFSSPFPNFFVRFPNLRTLQLHDCSIQGTIPPGIFTMPSLEYLDVSYNPLLMGYLPEFSVNGSLKSLILSETNASGNIPNSISNLVQLSTLVLTRCNFSGYLPHSIQNLSQLEVLDLSYNMFSGRVPDLSRLRKLTYLALDDNTLTGSLPFPLFELPFLHELRLSFNQFSGTLSEFPHALSSPIRVMTLGSNKLEGPLPLSLFNFQNLNILDLSFNNFSGSVELSNLQKLEHLTTLDLSYNNLSIASGSSNLTWFANGIRELDLASCKLTSFPNLVNRSGLDYLDLSNNQIHGKIPKWIWNVNHVNLSYNLLEGFERPLPSKHSANFTLIDLHHNMLTGPLLPVLPRGAYYIDYSDNRLTSTIPIDIGDYLSFTIFLSLSMNQISGTIPLSMCNATNLEILDLSGNGLGGTIPQCLFNTSSHLAIVNLSANKLKGAVPGMFSQGCALRTLDLSYNMFEGEIPRTLANCAGLEVLNLAQNKIHDKFPCWLKGLPNLHVLVLRSNKLTGAVQCSNTMNLNLWRSLQILDLAYNKLFGALPSEGFFRMEPHDGGKFDT